MPSSEPQFAVGDRCFGANYTEKWGTVERIQHTHRDQTHGVTGEPLPDTTWYLVRNDDGTVDSLDDAHGHWTWARIVPPHVAERWGFGADPNPRTGVSQ